MFLFLHLVKETVLIEEFMEDIIISMFPIFFPNVSYSISILLKISSIMDIFFTYFFLIQKLNNASEHQIA